MSLTATVLFNQPVTFPDGTITRNDMDKPRRPPSQSRSAYRIKQANGRAANLQRLVEAVANGARTMEDMVAATDLSLSMVKKAVKVLEAERRIERANGRSRPHLYRVAR